MDLWGSLKRGSPFSATGSLPVHQELTTGRDKMGIGGDSKADLHLEETEATRQRELGITCNPE